MNVTAKSVPTPAAITSRTRAAIIRMRFMVLLPSA
jgi:hypothetical protein